MSFFKKRIWVLIAVLVLAGAGAFIYQESQKPLTWKEALKEYLGEPEYKTVDPDKPLHEQTSTFEIAGRTFEMPKVYIQTNIGNKSVLPEGINLLYVLPDFTSRAGFRNKQEYEQARNDRRFAHMLIKPESSRPSLDEMVSNRRKFLIKEEYIGNQNGLEYYKWYQGLPEKPELNREIYLEKDANGKVLSFIECWTVETGATIPGCTHKFRDKALLYSIYYNKDNYLSTWREQRSSAIKFINSFELKPENLNQKEN